MITIDANIALIAMTLLALLSGCLLTVSVLCLCLILHRDARYPVKATEQPKPATGVLPQEPVKITDPDGDEYE